MNEYMIKSTWAQIRMGMVNQILLFIKDAKNRLNLVHSHIEPFPNMTELESLSEYMIYIMD